MKKFGLATIVAGGLTAATLGLAAPAVAAPTGPGNAQETISDLKADGYNVIVNRVGGTPLEASDRRRRPTRPDLLADGLRQPGRQPRHHRHEQDGVRRRQVTQPHQRARGTPSGAPSSWAIM